MSKRNVVPLASSTLAELANPTVGRIARATGGSVMLLQVTTPPIHFGYRSPLLPMSPAIVDETVRDNLAKATHYLERVAASSHFAGGRTRSGSLVWVGGGDHPFSGSRKKYGLLDWVLNEGKVPRLDLFIPLGKLC